METEITVDSEIVDVGEALLAARIQDDLTRVAEIIDRWGVDLAHSRYGAQVYEAAMELPIDFATTYPGLAFRFEDIGRLPIGTTPLRLPRNMQEAEAEFARNGDLKLRQALLPLNTRRRVGRHNEALAIARAGIPLAEASVYPLYGDRSRILPYWYLQSGTTAFHAGELDAARRYYLTAWTHRAHDPYGFVACAIALNLAAHDAFIGDRVASVGWIERANDMPRRRDLWVDRFLESNLTSAVAVHAIDTLDPDTETLVQAAMHPSQRGGQWQTLLWLHVSHALTHGNTARARLLLDDTLAAKRHELTANGLANGIIPLLRATIHLAMGQGMQALAELTDAPDVAGLTQCLRARTNLAAGDPAAALDIVAAMATAPMTSPRAWTEALLVAAAAHLAAGDRAAAMADLRRALVRIVDLETPRALATIPRRILEEMKNDVPGLPPLLAVLDERGVTDIYPESVKLVAVTEREMDLLRELSSGQTLADIAKAHFVSVNTLRTHLANLRKKLGAKSRDEVLTKARNLGLLDR